jgi:hypothetical protein
LCLKDKHRTWGAKKITVLYERKYSGDYVPCRSTIEELFKLEGLTKRKRKAANRNSTIMQKRTKPGKPNEL